MPSHEEFEQAIRHAKENLSRIGDHVVQELPVPDAAPEGTRAIECRHGDLTFLVTAQPDREYFELVYPLNLIANLAQQVRSDDGLRKILPRDFEANEAREQAMVVARELVDSMAPGDKHRLVFHLIERLSSPSTSFVTQGTAGGGLAAFECRKKLFPYEESFTLARLNDAVQAVISVGHRATQFLYATLVLDVSKSGEGPEAQLRFRMPGDEATVHREEIPIVQ